MTSVQDVWQRESDICLWWRFNKWRKNCYQGHSFTHILSLYLSQPEC